MSRDGRAQKQARSLAAAGANVLVVGYAGVDHFTPEGYEAVQLERTALLQRRWGRETVWWPIRVMVNLSCEAARSIAATIAPMTFGKRLHRDGRMVAAAVAFQPDVVHAHNPTVGLAALAVVQHTGAKLIYDARELFESYYTLAPRSHGFRFLERQRVSDRVERVLMGQADAVLTVSPAIGRRLTERFSRTDIAVVYNSLPGAAASAASVHHPVRILNQAGFRTVTHDHLMVEAMAHLRDVATLTMQGAFGNEAYRRRIEETIERLDLADVVTLTGPYRPLECVELAQGFDIGVATYMADTPSKDRTLANRFFTYLSAGLALAMPDVEAHRTFPGYDEFGILLDTSSPETIATGLRALIDDPERIARMKRAALDAAPRYSWEQQEQKLVSVYVQVLSGGADNA